MTGMDSVRRRVKAADTREIFDFATEALHGIPVVGSAINYLGDQASNAILYAYSMLESPYAPWRGDANILRFIKEGVVYGLAGLAELIPGAGFLPSYSVAARMLEGDYRNYMEQRALKEKKRRLEENHMAATQPALAPA